MPFSLFSNTQIYIFNILHILDQICDDISKYQLLACLQVSRTWKLLFTPQTLCHVRFSNLKNHQTWIIFHCASLILYLTIVISDAGWFLNNSGFSDILFNSHPVGLRDFYLSVYCLFPVNLKHHPTTGYPWKKEKQGGEETVLSASPPLRQLERLVLVGPHSRPPLGSTAEATTEVLPFITDQVAPNLTDDEWIGCNSLALTSIVMVKFPVSGAVTEQMYSAISKMVARSSATFEVAWIIRWNWESPAGEIVNLFHIDTTRIWTHCTRLKELGLYRNGGSLMIDPCWTSIRHSRTLKPPRATG
ncbi:MAG: hypothetical protein J3R72DRAFT_492281 [Linnemannia gamsii]|nr:MAG: hypothetical protein J3R72DRAFT_492281 [Linnemannia gamsii]